MRIITYSTLYPNAVQVAHGLFVERRVLELKQKLAADYTVVAPVPWFPFSSDLFGRYGEFAKVPKEEHRHGHRVLHPRYPIIPKIGMNVSPWLLAKWTEREVRKLATDRSEPLLIDAHYFYPDGVAAALIARRLNIPFVVTARGSDLNLIAKYSIPRRWIKWAADQAAAIITVSEALISVIPGIETLSHKCHVIRNGVNLQFFYPNSKSKEPESKIPAFISVGNLVLGKGHEIVIDFIARDESATLKIIGNGPEEHRLRQKVSRLGVESRIEFTGSVSPEKLRDYYSSATATILMSKREGMPNVLLESLACGTPVIATRVGGIPELIDKLEFGELVDSPDSQGLAAAWARLQSRPFCRAKIREMAESLSWDASMDQLAALMLSIFRS